MGNCGETLRREGVGWIRFVPDASLEFNKTRANFRENPGGHLRWCGINTREHGGLDYFDLHAKMWVHHPTESGIQIRTASVRTHFGPPHLISLSCAQLQLIRTFFFLAAVVFSGTQLRAASFALSFDGLNDYVSFGPAPALGTPTFTLETWFKRTGAGVSTSTGTGGVTAIPLVAKGRAEDDGSNLDMNYFLGIRASDGVLCADFEEGAGGSLPGLNHPIVGVTPVASNVWNHAAVTYDGTKWQLFLNGVLESELTVGKPPRADSIQYASLGSALMSTGQAEGFFKGVLDEVRIWNHARTAQQIAASMNAEILTASGLLGRWGLNDGSGTTARDSSGIGPSGWVNGPSWVPGFFQDGGTLTITRGPYLQMGTPTSVFVRWRTNLPTNSRVQYGTAEGALSSTTDDTTSTTEHQVQLTGLIPDTQYFYSIGSTSLALAAGPDFTFFTAPPTGASQPTRIWVLGDSGTANANAANVRNGFTTFNGNRYTDLWLMLGDNAYQNGSDADYQAAVFDMYPRFLRQSVLWPTIGNHDTAGLTSPPESLPYFQMFTLPTNGEAGGVASGTEKYYSFDFGRIHFICLDSMSSSSRQPGSSMLTWLQADLESTLQDWIIAYWHHPPYSKGSHNSDGEGELVEMRQYVVPLLEAGGVDLVLAGHSHNYERSFLINGHYGYSTTFNSTMKLDGGNGREDSTGVYAKPVGLPANQGAVYVVAGNGGSVTNWTGGSLAEFNPTPHPVMFYSARHLGSMVLDVNGPRLDVKMIRETGAIDDYFSIVKNVPNTAPSVSILSPTGGANFNSPATVTVTASANDSDGTIAQVDFYAGTTLIGTATIAPYSVAWNNVVTGSYALTAAATDNLGATTVSPPVNVTVTTLSPPAAPTGLTATAVSRTRINLAWADNANNETGYLIERSANGNPFIQIASVTANVGTFSDIGPLRHRRYAYRVRATNGAGQSAYSNIATAKTL